MRHFILLATGLIVFAASGHSLAGPISPVGLSRGDAGAPVILVQAKKDESLQQKAKRAWRNLVGYKFDVNCPIKGTARAPKLARAVATHGPNASRAIRCAGFPTPSNRLAWAAVALETATHARLPSFERGLSARAGFTS